jgi:hypothetical protein
MSSRYLNLSAAAAARLVVCAGFVLALGAGLPGHLSYDSVIQLYEGHTGVIESFNPPIMAWLLGAFDAFVPGTGLYVAAVALLLFATLYALPRLHERASWLSVPTALALVLTPQVLVYQAIVWKDVLFANLAVAGFVCLAYGARRLAEPDAGRLPVLASFFLFALASLTRQNGMLVLPAAAVALAVVAGGRDRRRFVAYGAGSLALGVVLMLATSALLGRVYRGDRTAAAAGGTLRMLQHYDIVGTAAHSPGLALPILDAADPTLDDKVRADASVAYSPQRIDTFDRAPEMGSALWAAPAKAINDQWLSLIRHNTGAYLRHRWDAFRWVLATPRLERCLPVWVGVSGPADKLQALGMQETTEPQDRASYSYAAHFFHTPVYSHLTYAFIAAAAIVLLAWRRRPADVVMAAMLLSALAFAASFFLITLACDYRYLYYLDLSALVSLFYLSLDPRFGRGPKGARGGATAEAQAGLPSDAAEVI